MTGTERTGGKPATIESFTVDCDGETLGCTAARPVTDDTGAAGALTAVVLHGAGTSDRQRLTGLLGDVAARGHHALAFDFSGHGDSTGLLADSSLRRRFLQARAVIDGHVPARHRLAVIGFSMSGQTVADLARHYGARVASVGLCAPAVYAPDAWTVPFGAGFTEIIRTPESWRNSPALDVFRSLSGRAVLATPAADAVIPPAVTEAVATALGGSRARFTRLTYPDAEHRLALWFTGNPEPRGRFVDAVLRDGA